MKRHLPRLTLPALMCVVVSCSRETARLDALREQLTVMEAGREKMALELAEQKRALKSTAEEQDRLRAARTGMEKAIKEAREEAGRLTEEFAGYKADYRRSMQAKAKGMSLPDFAIDGRQYQDVVVNSITSSELTVIHSQGLARLPLDKMPASLQALFGYDSSSVTKSMVNIIPSRLLTNDVTLDLIQGKAAVDEAKRLLDEKKRAAQRRKPPKYLAAPTASKGYSWRTGSSFEGSYWAPLKGKKH